MRASEPSAIEDSSDGFIGKRFGRYVLCRELGVGGMARVHLARAEGEAGFLKLVALKSIHPHLANEQTFVDMFLDEAHLASRIDHRNVCAVFDFGKAEGTYFLAMEYLVGEPVSRIFEVLKARAPGIDPEERAWHVWHAARVLADAAEGLHAAHELRDEHGQPLGVVHRDVSPQNLFLTFDGTTKVVDFGCAKAAQRISHTDTGILKGKVSYASPEQIKQGPVDRRADVWALGVCLWELITFERLFDRETDINAAMAVLQDPIPLASEGRPWVPTGLAVIARKALARDPNQRYATARELGRDIRTWIAGSGLAVEAVELAEWMNLLFSGERAEKLAMVEEAKSAVLPSPSAPATPSRAPSDSSPRGPRLSLEDAVRDRPKRSSGNARLFIVLGILALVGVTTGVAGVAWRTGRFAGWTGGGASADGALGEDATATAASPPDDETGQDVAFDQTFELDEAASEEDTSDPGTEARVGTEDDENDARGGSADRDRDRDRDRERDTTQAHQHRSREPEEVEPTPNAIIPDVGAVRIEAAGGWSEVYEGTRHLGRTPLRVELSGGAHVLELLPFGHGPGTTQMVRVVPGTEMTIRVAIRDQRAPDTPNPVEAPPPLPTATP